MNLPTSGSHEDIPFRQIWLAFQSLFDSLQFYLAQGDSP